MSEYYAVVRSTDHLAHYGVKGMKWGVRKAIARGNQRALDRHFRKAAKKLRKLQDIGLHSGKYAAKSAAYGAAAAGTGTLAVGGTKLTGDMLSKIGKSVPKLFKVNKLGTSVEEWGKKPGIYKTYMGNGYNVNNQGYPSASGKTTYTILSNDALYRIGAGLAAAGLAAKSAQNAYRASHGAKYRQQASEWKNTMDNEFAGTKYAGKYVVQPKKKRKRRV